MVENYFSRASHIAHGWGDEDLKIAVHVLVKNEGEKQGLLIRIGKDDFSVAKVGDHYQFNFNSEMMKELVRAAFDLR